MAYPYYDQRLVEFIMAIPSDQLGRPGQSRFILRNALANYLPIQNLTRPGKTDFSPLFKHGVLAAEKHNVHRLLGNPQIVTRNYIEADWIKGEIPAGDEFFDYGFNLWICISLELWLQRFWS